VAYFSSKGNSLSQEHKNLLQDLALVCNFKATSDLPQWLSENDREQLHAFLEDKSEIKRLKRYQFQIGERKVDFSSAMNLPDLPKGLEIAQANLIGWLGSQGWVLRLLDKLGKNSLERIKKEL
jgi:hypothetical protein